jgi:hypothetical protein
MEAFEIIHVENFFNMFHHKLLCGNFCPQWFDGEDIINLWRALFRGVSTSQTISILDCLNCKSEISGPILQVFDLDTN